MFRSLRVAVVVPAFNEEDRIAETLRGIPAFIDQVIVVDDASSDRTSQVARAEVARVQKSRRTEILRHPSNRGVGAAIVTGYRRALELDVDVAVVMAGDGQMDPADLPGLLDPIWRNEADYVKGNRFAAGFRPLLGAMPIGRVIGNVALSLATKVTSGYSHLFDSQCGYTAASRRTLEVIDASELFPRYGYPNDLLARLKSADLIVSDAPVKAIYGPSWRSGIRVRTVIYPMSFVLMRSFVRRLITPVQPRSSVPRREASRCASGS